MLRWMPQAATKAVRGSRQTTAGSSLSLWYLVFGVLRSIDLLLLYYRSDIVGLKNLRHHAKPRYRVKDPQESDIRQSVIRPSPSYPTCLAATGTILQLSLSVRLQLKYLLQGLAMRPQCSVSAMSLQPSHLIQKGLVLIL